MDVAIGNGIPGVSMQRAIHYFTNSLGLRISMGSLGQQLNWLQTSPITGSLGWWQEMDSWDSVSPLLGDHIRIAFLYFRMFPLYHVSIPPLKCSSISDVSSCILSLNLSTLPFGTQSSNSVPISPQFTHKIYSIYIAQEDPQAPQTFPLYITSLGLWIIIWL